MVSVSLSMPSVSSFRHCSQILGTSRTLPFSFGIVKKKKALPPGNQYQRWIRSKSSAIYRTWSLSVKRMPG